MFGEGGLLNGRAGLLREARLLLLILVCCERVVACMVRLVCIITCENNKYNLELCD